MSTSAPLSTPVPQREVSWLHEFGGNLLNDLDTSIYQSNGLCHDFCIDDYAYAITQDNSCWCSNYAPAKSTREDTDKCDTSCPGYPSEYCGGDDLYGYLSLGNVEPSGTQGASTSSTATVS